MLYIILALLLLLYLYLQNNLIQVTNYTIPGAPKELDGFRIVQVSDLHNDLFGEHSEYLLKKIREQNPDLIVVTGDMIDSRSTYPEISLEFAERALAICPVYYTPGNHENRTDKYPAFRAALREIGVVVLEDEVRPLAIGGARLNIVGLNDPNIRSRRKQPNYAAARYAEAAKRLAARCKTGYSVVLAHRPEYFELYAECGFDAVFCGHAHGGQFRIPFSGRSVYAPNQGLLPRYTQGAHNDRRTTMIVSRGLGSSAFPTRLFNRPELVAATLRHQAESEK